MSSVRRIGEISEASKAIFEQTGGLDGIVSRPALGISGDTILLMVLPTSFTHPDD